jgi:hypothetical protein
MPPKRLISFAAAVGATAVVTLAACNDSTGYEATIPVFRDTAIVFAMTGSPPQLPNAFSFVSGRATRIDSLAFDVAFDITADNQVALYPVTTIGQLSAPRRIGIRVDSAGFETIQRAPVSGFVHDSLVVVPIGRTFILEVPGNCQLYSLSAYQYSKVVIDTVDPVTRQIAFHAVTDPNCGFRSFKTGVPKD